MVRKRNPNYEAFWKWFGKSVVVDGTGRPKLQYHGGSFDADDPSGISVHDLGAHFGTKRAAETRASVQHIDQEIPDADIWEENGRYFLDEDMWPNQPTQGFKTEDAAKQFVADQMEYSEAPDYVQITEAFLRIENPLELPDLGTWPFQGAVLELRNQGVFSASDADRAFYAYNLSDQKGFNAIKALLRRKGYDGIKYRNEVEDRGKYSYIIFKPQQAKSPTNRGGFSSKDPCMRNPNDLMFGTPKQVSWARSIRRDMQPMFDVVRDRYLVDRAPSSRDIRSMASASRKSGFRTPTLSYGPARRVLETLRNSPWAGWWIDHRNIGASVLFDIAVRMSPVYFRKDRLGYQLPLHSAKNEAEWGALMREVRNARP